VNATRFAEGRFSASSNLPFVLLCPSASGQVADSSQRSELRSLYGRPAGVLGLLTRLDITITMLLVLHIRQVSICLSGILISLTFALDMPDHISCP
jgi:hypothetical protein